MISQVKVRRNARVSRMRESNMRVQTAYHYWPGASLHRSDWAELPSSPSFLILFIAMLPYARSVAK